MIGFLTASFELMRKEQQKALQEKHKPNAEKHTAEYDSEISVLLEGDKKDRGLLENTKVDVMTSQPVVNNDSGKSSSSQNLPSRPLVPPGFKTTVTDKTSGPTTSNHSCLTEVLVHLFVYLVLEHQIRCIIINHSVLCIVLPGYPLCIIHCLAWLSTQHCAFVGLGFSVLFLSLFS